ncbi:MAG TPA: SLC13 family permease [Hyphomicrobiaceae bacterium]|nr:SLC13 family permease [Hyphomicrobiaceae bacterium]
MTAEIAICLGILVCAVALFAWDRVPADVVALGVMLAVIATGLLPPDKAFAGFASDTVLMILGLLVMTAGLVQTGVVEMAGRSVLAIAGENPRVFLPVIMVSIAAVSAFMSNTAATAFFVPLVLGYASKIGASPSRFLLPLAFASILTSSVTLISTSTNLIVSDLLTRYQQPPMGMFEMAPVGIPIAVLGILYVLLLGVRLLPERSDQKAEEAIGERKYQADVVVAADGPLVGKTLHEAKITDDAGLKAVKVVRGEETVRRERQLSELELRAGDELFIEGLRADLLKIKDIRGLDFKADVHLPDAEEDKDRATIVEGVLLPRSPLIGQSLRSLEFKERYGLQVLAIHRAGRVPTSISAARLRMGDVLLLQGTPEDVRKLERGNLFNIFGSVQTDRLNRSRAPLATAIFALAIAAAAAKLAALPVAMLGGAFLMLLLRCVSPEEAYRQVEWKALILIGSLLSLGAAMEASGAGKYMAQQLIGLVGSDSRYALLTCFFVLTVALTQPMSNQAAALVVLPFALQTGIQIGVDPRAFGMMVAVAASCSYLTPLEPSCLMVYGPGKYQFWDFFKVGAPLTVLIYAIAIVLVPVVWPI